LRFFSKGFCCRYWSRVRGVYEGFVVGFLRFFLKDFVAEGAGMERVEQLDYDGIKDVRKPQAFSVRKHRSG